MRMRKLLLWLVYIVGAEFLSAPAIVQRTINGAYNPFHGSISIPNRLAIAWEGEVDPKENLGMRIAFPYSKLLNMDSRFDKKAIVSAIQNYVRQHGTLDELVINAHGSPGCIYPQRYSDNPIHVIPLLGTLLKIQEASGTQIAKRFVFCSCNVLTNLTTEDVARYRALSRQLGAEIAGATNSYKGGWLQACRMACFHPNGHITRDQLDVPFDLWVLYYSADSELSGLSSAWFYKCQDEPRTPAWANMLRFPKPQERNLE